MAPRKKNKAKVKPVVPPFADWLQETESDWTWNWLHQRSIYRKLDKVTSCESRRLMIFLPPRHSKSETVTVRYSAWRLEKDPSLNIILGSYNQKLANRFSRKIKRIVEARIELASDRKAAEEWETAEGGGVRAVGVGAGVTGFGAGLIVIDDPVKSRAEAESATIRERVWDWFNDDVYTRLEPGAAIVLIQTRWHEDDLAGRLMSKMNDDGGEPWEIVSLPALAECPPGADAEVWTDEIGRLDGEALCPERYGRDALLKIKRQLGAYSFAALYQQRPVPAEGGLFKRSWFRNFVDRSPVLLNWARGYDLAVSTRTSADYTASFRCAFDAEGNLFIADGFRGRIEYPEQRRYVIDRMRSETRTAHVIEKALHGEALVQDIRSGVAGGRAPLRALRVEADKYTRALTWANLAEDGKVILVRGGWTDEFIAEACSFPGGRHDDQIDAVSLAVRQLGQRRSAKSF